MSCLNPKVSRYWLWLVVFAGVSMALPIFDRYPLLMIYLDALQPTIGYIPKKGLTELNYYGLKIGIHAFLSVILAVWFYVIFQVSASSKEKQTESDTFSLSALLLGITIFGFVFGGLKYLDSDPIMYFVAILFAAGRVVALYLAAYLIRFRSSPSGR